VASHAATRAMRPETVGAHLRLWRFQQASRTWSSPSTRSFVSTNGLGILDIEDSCRDVSNGKFSLTANGSQYDVDITHEEDLDRYSLTSPVLDADFSQQDGSRRSSSMPANLVGYMNREQAFRTILESAGYTSHCGEFVNGCRRLRSCCDESGGPTLEVRCSPGGWPSGRRRRS
jgi:hypothetical protein